MGEVCVRSIEKDAPKGGMVFCSTDWHDNARRLVDGYPVFQGVRGVCAKIFFDPSVAPQVTAPSLVGKMVRDVSQTLRSPFETDDYLPPPSTPPGPSALPPPPETPLQATLRRRTELNDELGSIERQHIIFKACKPHRQTYASAIQKNLDLIHLYSTSMDSIPRTDTRLQSTAELNQQLCLQLIEMNKRLTQQVAYLEAQSGMNSSKYKEEKERVEKELEKVKQKLKKMKK
jgi:hypothetical protein